MAGKFFTEFKDERDDGDSSAFLSAAEKQLLIDEGVAFPITSVSSANTQFGPRWILGIEVEGEPRMLGFSKGKVFSRDRMLVALEAHFDNGGEPPEVKIVMNGRSQILVDAEA